MNFDQLRRLASNVRKCLSLVAVAALFGLMLYIFHAPGAQTVNFRQTNSISFVTEYTVSETSDPSTPLGVIQQYRFPVNEQVAGRDLVFYAHHQYIRVFMDGEMLYSWMPSGARAVGKTLGSQWISIPFYQEDLGREILVEVIPVYEVELDSVPEFVLGSDHEIYKYQLRKDGVQFGLSVLIILVGIVFLGIAVFRMFRSHQGKRLASLSLFAVMIGLWRVTTIPFTAYLFAEHSVFMYDLSLAALMIGMMPLTIFVGLTQQYRWPADLYCIIASVSCLVQIGMRVCFGVDFREMLTVTHGLLLLGVISILLLVFFNRHSKKHRQTSLWERLLPLLLVVGITADLVMFYVQDSLSDLTNTLLAVLLYMVITGLFLIHKFFEQEKKLITQQSELLEARTAVMLSQIQPHFLYNTLNSIAELCREDSEKARSATIDFAEYLRVNLKAIQQKKVVPFQEELRHVQRYLNLEKMRFEEDLNVVYDIRATEFSLPQLSVQPLVENAVKHGVGEQEEGGTVAVRSWEEAECWCLCIEDDGVGFDAESVQNDGKVHIGIDNSRMRLQTLCGGTLEITSQPGRGTTALIRIPKEEEE